MQRMDSTLHFCSMNELNAMDAITNRFVSVYVDSSPVQATDVGWIELGL